MGIVFGVILVISGIIVFLIAKGITSRINDMMRILKDISEGEGDLTARIHFDGEDEFADVGKYFNAFVVKLEDMVISVRGSANEVNNVAATVSSGNNSLSQATQEMASSLEETTASIEEITSSIQETAESAEKVSTNIDTTAREAEEGSEMLNRMKDSTASVKDSGQKISEIITMVNELSFQTNLLSLNAAVEAARAGDEGRGFAVVATEIRNLAKRSTDAANDIQQLVESNEEKINEMAEVSADTTELLLKVVDKIKEANIAVRDIKNNSMEQARGIQQINTAVVQMDEVTQNNAALVEEAGGICN
jgi:methyl-accepting chemotaxis protein